MSSERGEREKGAERGGREARERGGGKGWSHVTRHVSMIRTRPPGVALHRQLLRVPFIGPQLEIDSH